MDQQVLVCEELVDLVKHPIKPNTCVAVYGWVRWDGLIIGVSRVCEVPESWEGAYHA